MYDLADNSILETYPDMVITQREDGLWETNISGTIYYNEDPEQIIQDIKTKIIIKKKQEDMENYLRNRKL